MVIVCWCDVDKKKGDTLSSVALFKLVLSLLVRFFAPLEPFRVLRSNLLPLKDYLQVEFQLPITQVMERVHEHL